MRVTPIYTNPVALLPQRTTLRFGNEEPPKPQEPKDSPSWMSRLMKRVQISGIWLLATSVASAYPLYHGFQAYRLNKEIRVLEAQPELELLGSLEGKGQFLHKVLGDYPTLSDDAKRTLNDTVDILLREYTTDVKNETAEHFKNHGLAEDQFLVDLLAENPRFSQQSQEYTRHLFTQVSWSLDRGLPPWLVMGTYPRLLNHWINQITPDIGWERAEAAKARIDTVFSRGQDTLTQMGALSDEAGRHHYHMVLGALAAMMLSLLTLTVLQNQKIQRLQSNP